MARLELQKLADRVGILSGFIDDRGKRVVTSDEARARVLVALGYDVATEAGCREALERLHHAQRQLPIDRVRVVVGKTALPVRSEGGSAWRVTLEGDTGGEPLRLEGRRLGRSVALPKLEPGYWDVTLESGALHATQRLIVSPGKCVQLAELTDEPQVAGVWANLYTVRSAGNWGVGDLADAGRLAERAAAAGAQFLGVNPLHALHNKGWDISPYSPVSRLFKNPLYIDVAQVPGTEPADLRDPTIEKTRAADQVEYEAIWGAKRSVLRRLFDRRRPAELEAFKDRGGRPLADFAVFMALTHAQSQIDWRRWPEGLRSPRSPEVQRFATEHAADVDFEIFLQLETERQLAQTSARCKAGGMAVGLYTDLAVGTAPSGCDPWAWPELFVPGMSMGAPPDSLGPNGQVWGLIPVSPLALAAGGFELWRTLLANALRHSGALRIDHAIGLLQQFWVPEGQPGSAGAYVRFPLDALLAIAALESRRARALVIGEDLGTVPPGLQSRLARWGVLSSRVLMFERRWGGEFRRAGSISRRALVTANTHDLAPLAGFFAGRDLEIRRDVGDLDHEVVADGVAARARDRGQLIERLRRSRLLNGEAPDAKTLVGAVHRFLRRTQAPLVGLGLDDLAGETEPVNLPGVTLDKYPSWSRRMRRDLESIPIDIPPRR